MMMMMKIMCILSMSDAVKYGKQYLHGIKVCLVAFLLICSKQKRKMLFHRGI